MQGREFLSSLDDREQYLGGSISKNWEEIFLRMGGDILERDVIHTFGEGRCNGTKDFFLYRVMEGSSRKKGETLTRFKVSANQVSLISDFFSDRKFLPVIPWDLVEFQDGTRALLADGEFKINSETSRCFFVVDLFKQ